MVPRGRKQRRAAATLEWGERHEQTKPSPLRYRFKETRMERKIDLVKLFRELEESEKKIFLGDFSDDLQTVKVCLIKLERNPMGVENIFQGTYIHLSVIAIKVRVGVP